MMVSKEEETERTRMRKRKVEETPIRNIQKKMEMQEEGKTNEKVGCRENKIRRNQNVKESRKGRGENTNRK